MFGASNVKWCVLLFLRVHFGDQLRQRHLCRESVAYKADEALYDDGVYLSDHRPVTVDLVLP